LDRPPHLARWKKEVAGLINAINRPVMRTLIVRPCSKMARVRHRDTNCCGTAKYATEEQIEPIMQVGGFPVDGVCCEGVLDCAEHGPPGDRPVEDKL